MTLVFDTFFTENVKRAEHHGQLGRGCWGGELLVHQPLPRSNNNWFFFCEFWTLWPDLSMKIYLLKLVLIVWTSKKCPSFNITISSGADRQADQLLGLIGASTIVLIFSVLNLILGNPAKTLIRNLRFSVLMASRELEAKDVPLPIGNYLDTMVCIVCQRIYIIGVIKHTRILRDA